MDWIDKILVIVAVVGLIIVPTILIAGNMYCNAVALGNDYRAKCKTVHEIENMLATANVSIGNGLELTQLRARLGDAIETRNTVERDIYNWLACPFFWHKDIVEQIEIEA